MLTINKNELCNLLQKITDAIIIFFISYLRLGSFFEACSPNSDLVALK